MINVTNKNIAFKIQLKNKLMLLKEGVASLCHVDIHRYMMMEK
jgi:hypothetical protein